MAYTSILLDANNPPLTYFDVQRKKSRTHKKPGEGENPNAPKTPKTFVMRSGEVGHSVMGLVSDIRRVMEPNTATKLRVKTAYCLETLQR
jgi:hypothetical protein